MERTKTTIYLGDDERQAIDTLQRMFGLSSQSDAIRLALRLSAMNPQGFPEWMANQQQRENARKVARQLEVGPVEIQLPATE